MEKLRVGSNMLHAFGHPVTACCDMLPLVAACCGLLLVVACCWLNYFRSHPNGQNASRH